MGFPRILNGTELDTHGTDSSETTPLVGQKMVIEDGRTFRYTEAGGTALINGRTTQSIATAASSINEAIDTLAVGATVLTGVGATGANPAADLYKGGYVQVITPANLGPIMQIKSNTLFASNVGTLTLFNPLPIAIAVGDVVTYVESPFRDVIIAATTPTAPVVGVVGVAVAANQYGWLCTGGPARVLTQGTLIIGDGTMASLTTAGAATPWIPETDTVTGVMSQPLGQVMLVKATTEKSPIFLRLEA